MKKLIWSVVGGFISLSALQGAVYNGNQVVTQDPQYTFDGAVGTGSLTLSDNGTTISGTFTRGNSAEMFGYSLVLFIDSVDGGIADTTRMMDNGRIQRSVSGRSSSGYYKSDLIFASGFRADYALVLNADQSFSYLFGINADSSLSSPKTIYLSTTWPNAKDFGFSFNWSDISGGGPNVSSFKFESTYLDPDGYRSLESFESMTGTIGYNTSTFSSYDQYPQTAPVPEPTNLALAGFGGLAGAGGAAGWARRRFKRRCGTRRGS